MNNKMLKDLTKINNAVKKGVDLTSLLFDENKKVEILEEDLENAQKLIDLFRSK